MSSETNGPYPTSEALIRRLRLCCMDDQGPLGAVAVLDRVPEPFSSSYPSEIVTCRFGDAAPVRLLCKYAPPDELPAWHAAHNHRHGLDYEGLVYRHVLEPLRMTAARLWGTTAGTGDPPWLAIEYLEGCLRLNSVPAGLEDAATWIGQFHARNETRLSDPAMAFLTAYTADYYRGWARRTSEHAWSFRRDYPQIEALSATFEQAIHVLLEAPLTIVHGEYYPSNVLWRPEGIYPVDWETTAIAAGEIDLVSLTEHWPPDAAEHCEAAYVHARWPGGCDRAVFARRLAAARLYFALRWAAVPEALTAPEDRAYYLHRVADEMDRMDTHRAVSNSTRDRSGD